METQVDVGPPFEGANEVGWSVIVGVGVHERRGLEGQRTRDNRVRIRVRPSLPSSTKVLVGSCSTSPTTSESSKVHPRYTGWSLE